MIPRLYNLNLDAAQLQTLQGHAITTAAPTHWTLRDRIVIGIQVYRNILAVQTAIDMSDVDSYRLMLKATTNLSAEPYAYAPPGDWNSADDWSEADPDAGKICCPLALTGDALIALFGVGDAYIDLIGEIEVRDSTQAAFTLARFGVRIHQDVIQGGELAPDITGEDIKFEEVAGVQRMIVKFPDGLWYAQIPLIVDGQPTTHWELQPS